MHDNTQIVMALTSNDTKTLENAFKTGLNPNIIIRSKPLTYFCRSEKILDMLIEYGLDMYNNHTACYATNDILQLLINKYDFDIYQINCEAIITRAFFKNKLKYDKDFIYRIFNEEIIPDDLYDTIIQWTFP